MKDNAPVYMVSGYMRSGTSMMMKVLEGAGMTACYNTRKDEVLGEKYAKSDYHPNPEGFFELGRREFEDPGFPQHYAGKLIKVLHWRLEGLPSFRYRICFMTRDPKEIEVSYLKMFQRRPPFVLQRYHELLGEIQGTVEKRGDCELIFVPHGRMIKEPEKVLAELKGLGWPIFDIPKGASCVKRDLYRSKSENLETVRQSIKGLRTDLPEGL